MADNASNQAARSFVAVELPQEVTALLGEIQRQLAGNLGASSEALRFTRPEGIHLTLQFLGDVPMQGIAQVEAALRQAAVGHAPFRLEVGGLGAFPHARRPRVVWVGLAGDTEAALALAASVRERLEPLGLRPDKPFSPHLTLARVRREAGAADLAVLSRVLSLTVSPLSHEATFDATFEATFDATFEATFDVAGVSLMRSYLQPGGSRYEQQAYAELQG